MSTNPQVNAPTGTELPTPRESPDMATVTMRLPANVTEHQLQTALTWHSRGVPVIPCSRTDKGPMVRGFARDAPPEDWRPFCDREQITRWWTGKYRRAHVGILGGRGADGRGLVVIDLDMRKPDSVLPAEYAAVASGADVLERMAAAAGEPWPDTYTVLTP
ncbi:bifunctional DNA primase/polymerase, partial [Streptomyces sp. NPDC093595]|uniref:bifunctional DNA primase/polymerase n=1 Tax=Streptomyces sp. NPDC093595 TaxID=3366045 RepID=UPI0038097970